MFTPHQALQRAIEHREIFHDEMLDLMRKIMRGEVSPLMVSAILTGLRVKKETVGEIAAAAQVMREMSARVEVADNRHFLDIVGTGGDGAHTFNISTTSMFIAAAAGATPRTSCGATKPIKAINPVWATAAPVLNASTPIKRSDTAK